MPALASRLLIGWAGPRQPHHNSNPYGQATRALQGGFPSDLGWIGQALVTTKALITTKIAKAVAESRCLDRVALMVHV